MEFNKNFTVGQNAMKATELMPILANQAKKRMLAGIKVDLNSEKGTAIQIAGSKLGISPQSVRDASLLKREAPELAKEVQAGKKSLKRAFTEHKKRERLMETDINASFSESDVYFIYAESCNLVKIGRAIDAESRLAAIQTMSPVPLKLIKKIITNSPVKLEAELHKKFKDLRSHGEWFHYGTEIKDYLNNLGSEISCQN